MEKKTISGLIAIAAIAAAVILAGCVGSPYHVEYSIKGEYGPQLLVNVSGPADDLAVILTDPEGDTHITHISKRSLIDNFQSVRVYMCERGNPPAGTYKLVVKTLTPEKVVYKTEMKFKPGIVRITDVEISLEWHSGYGGAYGYSGFLSGRYNINVKNDGELPVVIDNILAVIDGEAIEPLYSVYGICPPGESTNIVNEVRKSYYHEPRMSSAVIELYSEGELVASSEAQITIE